MMVTIYIFASIWCLRLLLNLLSYIHLWYLKEYRFDRMLVHLKTKQGKRILFLPWRRPPVSPRSLFIFIGSLITIAELFTVLPMFILWKLLICDILLFPLTACFVLLTKIPTFVYHRFIIAQAVRRLRAHKKMMVIGITGSYGKTSTKEFLATILGQKFKTLKTEASKNSPIGIAEAIMSKLTPEHEVFIVEMGAYKRGEISSMCEMVKPEIGIVTAINEQHQDLFGTIEGTLHAKYELIAGLSGRKTAIVNADNAYTKQMAKQAEIDGCTVVYFSMKDKEQLATPVFRAVNIKTDARTLSFLMKLKKESVQVHVNLVGKHQVGNILAAAAAAYVCGMTLREIGAACSRIRPFSHTMVPIAGINGSLFIDDTFNNNPDAARAAIDYFAETKGKKILVFQPMIELGKYAAIRHREVGEYAGRVCDEIICTNDNFLEPFEAGVHTVNKKKIVRVLDAKPAADFLGKIVSRGDTVLFKGKESARVLSLLSF